MAAEIGHLALILAFALALVQAVSPLVGAHRGEPRLMALGRTAAGLQMGFVTLAFASLAAAYLYMDFSVELVAKHSHSTQPAVYRFAATWGSHEGSMLLWVLILALCGGAVARFGSSRWRGPSSIRCCRTPASWRTRRCSTSATSASRWPSPSPSRP